MTCLAESPFGRYFLQLTLACENIRFSSSKKKKDCSQSTQYYVSLESSNTTAAKAKTTEVFLLGSGLRIQLFLLALQPHRRVKKRPWQLYSQATLDQSHKVKLGDVCTQASLKVLTLKRRGFHVFIKASIVKEMIAVNTLNIFKVCWICNCFL